MPHVPGTLRRVGSYGSFLWAFVRARRTVGAVAPTSRGVGRRMAELAGVNAAHAVAEFGPGTGAITRELLDVMPEDGRLWAFEVYAPFVAHLRDTIDDHRLTVLPQSAETIIDLHDGDSASGLDAVVSSIPFSLMGPVRTAQVLHAVSRRLRPGGVFVALQYHPRFLPPFLRAAFDRVEREVYLWNIPPATLLRAREPVDAGAG